MKNIIIYSILILLFNSCKQNLKTSKHIAATVATNFYKENRSNPLVAISETKTKVCLPTKIRVYLNDPDTSGTNIRKIPNGKIIMKLIKDELNYEFFIMVTEAKNGWFKITEPIGGMENDIEIPNGEGWIHGSVISVDTRNYGGQQLSLLEKPKTGKTIKIIKKEVIGLRLKDVCGKWVKVEYEKTSGWIESKWLCGNPLTNCS